MEVSHIEHLGIAVKSLDEAIPYWENVLGLKCYAIEEVADQKVRTAFFKLGQTKIELLEPTSEDSTIAGFIEKRGIGIHHMAAAASGRAPLREAPEKAEQYTPCIHQLPAPSLTFHFATSDWKSVFCRMICFFFTSSLRTSLSTYGFHFSTTFLPAICLIERALV